MYRSMQGPVREFVAVLEVKWGFAFATVYEIVGGERQPLPGASDLLTLSEVEGAVLGVCDKKGGKNAAIQGWKVFDGGRRVAVGELVEHCGPLAVVDRSSLPPCPVAEAAKEAAAAALLAPLAPLPATSSEAEAEAKDKKFKRQGNFNKEKFILFARQDGKCAGGCERKLEVDTFTLGDKQVGKLQCDVDHIAAVGLCVARGRLPDGIKNVNDIDNLQLLCLACHGKKTNRDRAEIAAYEAGKRGRERAAEGDSAERALKSAKAADS